MRGHGEFLCHQRQGNRGTAKGGSRFYLLVVFFRYRQKICTDELGFIAPFDTFSAEDVPEDPLAVQVQLWMNKQGVYSIPWDFTVFPSQTFKQHFGSALLSYAQGRKTWAQVQENTVADWKSEAAASA